MTFTPLAELLAPASPLDLELKQRALQLAAAFQNAGLKRLALHLDDAEDLACALLGAWRAGVEVILPADAQPATRARLAPTLDAWLDDLDGWTAAEPLKPARVDLQAPLLTLSTSGSSGEPKLIAKQLFQLANEVAALECLWGASLGAATVLGSVSTQHIYGLLFRVLWPLCAGRPFARQALPFTEELQRETAALSRQGRRAVWISSPALLKRLGENLDDAVLGQVVQVFSSGGVLPGAAAKACQQRFGRYPTEVYGSSETGGIAWRRGPQPWQAFAAIELGQDADGALWLTSPYLPPGLREQTMDGVRLLGDGRFELLGRLDRIVKLEEKRIALPALEARLLGHPAIADVRLGVVQQGRALLGALVALSEQGLHQLRNGGRRALVAELREHLAGHCEAIALPRRWRLLLALPYSAQGKLAQAEVERLLAQPRPVEIEPLNVEQTADGWRLELEVAPDLAFFSGHFPTAPVVPGVVQVGWAQRLARQHLDLPADFAGMEVLKFQQLLRPGDRVTLTFHFDASRSKLHFAFRQGTAACSSGRILLREAQP
ncbi:AMP-dependent synthetase and ligase [Pseudomonas psychrotolerans L19]|uniref:AMP-binding protein n=1 Tax=Pseudomonas TaxID=286 RepID=UPI00023A17AD|nr:MULTISPECIES: AMP-binding protein [Pseudomonas]EHK70434.1 AMP-dependent synthetase and ligase [Pseudomonas psychrotolerans L19]MBA1180942.1 AMP-binding protein [Pseudomonas psychrotolerans]MBA1209846.1 AMP-binding protein [Pseudomonas psychrotolerans]TCQ84984.1 acyl-coenzyme A synthetase/AMP-(fatty) acid ligase [Pseudomonas sp. JUb52]